MLPNTNQIYSRLHLAHWKSDLVKKSLNKSFSQLDTLIDLTQKLYGNMEYVESI